MSQEGFGSYQLRASALVQVVNQLRDVGAQCELDLPSIIVSGNQSVGKSSIMEAICKIPLPRGEGTCTRCVVEIRLSTIKKEGDSWNCVVKLRKEFDDFGKPLKSVQEIPFHLTKSKDKLDTVIKGAQKLLLNPSISINVDSKKTLYETIAHKLEKSSSGDKELMFTRNIVCVEITGADVDLTLIDLPGIIKSVGANQDASVITMIENLVKSYIEKERALILAVITCKDEMENQAIFHMAREVDPFGNRTIGVLTKPDTIEVGTHDRWKSILTGGQYALKLGYYMVKMPSKAQMMENISGDDALILEEHYFQSTEPWATLKRRSDRFGIISLRNELSRLLTSLIEQSLPDMKKSTELAMAEANEILDTFPPPVSADVKIELLQTIRHFSTMVGYHINAQQNLKVFNQKIRKQYEQFKEAVMGTGPKLIAQKETSPSQSPSLGSFWKRSEPPKESPESKKNPPNSYTLQDLKNIVNSQKGKELDGYSPYSAFEHLVKKSQVDWKVHVNNLLNGISAELSSMLNKVAQDVFGRFPFLHNQIKFTTQYVQSDIQRRVQEQVGYTLEMEQRSPFTLNSNQFIVQKQEHLNKLMEVVSIDGSSSSQYPVTASRNEALKKALIALGDAGVVGLTPQSLMQRVTSSVTTGDSHLFDLMASASSYFEISSLRMIDLVCLQIDYHLLQKLSEILEKEVVHALGILDKDQSEMQRLCKEDPIIFEKRKDAQERLILLEQIWKNLHEFGYMF